MGIELFNLQRIVVAHGVSFEEFADDLITTMRSKSNSSQELLMFKLEMLYGDYFPIRPNEQVVKNLEFAFDAVVGKIKNTIERDQLYLGDRFDYCVTKHSNHGLLFTKNW